MSLLNNTSFSMLVLYKALSLCTPYNKKIQAAQQIQIFYKAYKSFMLFAVCVLPVLCIHQPAGGLRTNSVCALHSQHGK